MVFRFEINYNDDVEIVNDTKNVNVTDEVHNLSENCTNFDHEFYMN